LPYRNTDPLVRALHIFAAASGLSAELQEQILSCIEGKRNEAARILYAEKRANGWRRKYTPAQVATATAGKRRIRARQAAAAKAQKRVKAT
jgi:hypothetical protein